MCEVVVTCKRIFFVFFPKKKVLRYYVIERGDLLCLSG